MDLKDKLSHKWRLMTLIAGVVLLSSMTVQAQNTSEQNRKETPKAYFSPKQLASALSAINADDKQADIFLEAYLLKLGPQGLISPGDLVQVAADFPVLRHKGRYGGEHFFAVGSHPDNRRNPAVKNGLPDILGLAHGAGGAARRQRGRRDL